MPTTTEKQQGKYERTTGKSIIMDTFYSTQNLEKAETRTTGRKLSC